MRRPLLLALILTLLATGLVAGCGGGGGGKDVKKEFTTAYRPINDDLRALGTDVGQTISTAKGKSDAELATTFGSLATRTGAVKARLDALDAPSDYEADAKSLSEGLTVVQGDLRGISEAASKHDASGARTQVQELIRHSVAVRTARRALARKTGATL